MEWRHPKGYFCKWRQARAADGAERPEGHGVLEYPADNDAEWAEGAMADGRRWGPWVIKVRDGRWQTHEYEGDVPHNVKVPSPRAPASLPRSIGAAAP
jgi:hypothetical protein